MSTPPEHMSQDDTTPNLPTRVKTSGPIMYKHAKQTGTPPQPSPLHNMSSDTVKEQPTKTSTAAHVALTTGPAAATAEAWKNKKKKMSKPTTTQTNTTH